MTCFGWLRAHIVTINLDIRSIQEVLFFGWAGWDRTLCVLIFLTEKKTKLSELTQVFVVYCLSCLNTSKQFKNVSVQHFPLEKTKKNYGKPPVDICASNLSKQKSSARWFSPSARLLLLWLEAAQALAVRWSSCEICVMTKIKKRVYMEIFTTALRK